MASVMQIFKIAMVFLVFLSKGLFNELAGPAMIDLKLIFNTNYATLTSAVSGRGIGGAAGAFLGGIVADKFEKRLDVCTGMFCVISAAVIAYIPLAPTVDYLWFLYFGLGCATCVLNICGTRLALDLWKENNTAIIQLIHMGYGTGALLTPLICAPFLATVEFAPDNSLKVIKESRVQIPFFMIAVFTFILSVPFFFWHCSRQSDNGSKGENGKLLNDTKQLKQMPFLEMINPATYANGNLAFGSLMVFVLSMYYFNLIGCEKVFASFVRTFSVDALKFDKIQASYLNTVFWASFTFGRFCTCIISRYLHVNTMITFQSVLHLGSVSFLKYYASGTTNLFWFGTFVEGFLISPLYGLGVSFGSSQIEMSGMILTVIVLAGSIGDWTYLKTSGKMYDTYGPSAILGVMYIASWMIMGTVVIMWISRRKKQTMSS